MYVLWNEIGRPLTDVSVPLIGTDGNAFFILGEVTKALKQAGQLVEELIRQYQDKGSKNK